MKTLKKITTAAVLSVALAGGAVAQSNVPLNTTTTTQGSLIGTFAGIGGAAGVSALVALGLTVVVVGGLVYASRNTSST